MISLGNASLEEKLKKFGLFHTKKSIVGGGETERKMWTWWILFKF